MRPFVRGRGRSKPSFLALILVTGTTALSTDTYIAALPDVQRALGTTASAAQLTMTACIAGMALGQLLIGPVSDARGRRRLIIVATVAFTLMSVLCAGATSAWLLIGARAVQGIACGAAAAVGRAVVSDSSAGRQAAARFGTLSAVGLIAPVLGPVIGGVLLSFGDWRLIFEFLAVVGLAMVIAAAVGLPETLPPGRREPGGMRQLLDRAGVLLRDRAFAVPVLVQCLTVGGFFIYIGGSSFVLQEGLGLSQHQYSVLFGVNAAAMMASSVLYRALVLRLGPFVLRRIAMIVQTVSVAGLVGVALASAPAEPPSTPVWILLAGMTAGLGTYFPANSAISQEAGRRFGGTASALGGGVPFLLGAVTTPLTGLIGATSVLIMAIAMAVMFAAAGALALVLRQGTPAEGPVSTVSDRDRVPAEAA